MRGKLTSDSGPEASTTVRAWNRLRFLVFAVHRPVCSSKVNSLTSWPNRMWRRVSKLVAMSSRCRHISGAGEYVRDHVGFLTKEYEYSSEGTSQLAPGYVVSRQVPPTRSLRSRMMTSVTPDSINLIAEPSPVNPAPTMSVA